MSDPIPSDELNSRDRSQPELSDHVFPPRPEVVNVTEASLARSAGPVEHDGYCPPDVVTSVTPTLLRPERQRRAPWRRAPGEVDDLGEPATVYPPDTRTVLTDTKFPWRTCGRVGVPGGWGSGVMVGPRHMMTASHVIPWTASGGADWVTFTPAQFDNSTPFKSAHVIRIFSWTHVNGGDGVSSGEAAFDYVVCVLSARLGDATGWMGSRAYNTAWNAKAVWSHIGYPQDIAAGVRPIYTTNGVIDSTVSETNGGRTSLRLMHRNDVKPGQSGGPYFGWFPDETFPRVIGIQSSENWGAAGGPNAAGGGAPLPELIQHAITTEP